MGARPDPLRDGPATPENRLDPLRTGRGAWALCEIIRFSGDEAFVARRIDRRAGPSSFDDEPGRPVTAGKYLISRLFWGGFAAPRVPAPLTEVSRRVTKGGAPSPKTTRPLPKVARRVTKGGAPSPEVGGRSPRVDFGLTGVT